MLGVVQNPTHTPADRVIKSVAEKMGRGDTYTATPVGVLGHSSASDSSLAVAPCIAASPLPRRRLHLLRDDLRALGRSVVGHVMALG